MNSERDGKLIFTTALASIVVWLMMSDGYSGQLTPAANFYYTMHVVSLDMDFSIGEFKPFCKEVQKYSSAPSVFSGRRSFDEAPSLLNSTVIECSSVLIMTKHLVLISFLCAVYGFLVWKLVLPSPFSLLKTLFLRLRGRGG